MDFLREALQVLVQGIIGAEILAQAGTQHGGDNPASPNLEGIRSVSALMESYFKSKKRNKGFKLCFRGERDSEFRAPRGCFGRFGVRSSHSEVAIGDVKAPNGLTLPAARRPCFS